MPLNPAQKNIIISNVKDIYNMIPPICRGIIGMEVETQRNLVRQSEYITIHFTDRDDPEVFKLLVDNQEYLSRYLGSGRAYTIYDRSLTYSSSLVQLVLDFRSEIKKIYETAKRKQQN